MSSSASLTLVEDGLVARDDFGSTHIDALQKVVATADCWSGQEIDLYAPPLLVQLGVVDARDREAVSEQATERVANEGNSRVKKLCFDLGILTLDELWRFESECLRTLPNPRCLSFVVTEILRQSLVRVYHPSLGFHFLDLQKVQHLRPEIKDGSVIMAPIVPTRSAEGTTFLPSDRGFGLCTKTGELSKLPFHEQKEHSINEASARLRALITGEISAEQAQSAETADLESKGIQFRIPFGDWLEEYALKSLQEQLMGKWFTLRVKYLKEAEGRGVVSHPLFFNNPRFYFSGLLGATTISLGDYIFGPVFIECFRGQHLFAVRRGAVWAGQCAPTP